MTNQTSAQPQPQGTHHFVMTLQQVINGGFSMSTFANHTTPSPGMTRHDIYQWLLHEIVTRSPHLAGANVVFFSLEPNKL